MSHSITPTQPASGDRVTTEWVNTEPETPDHFKPLNPVTIECLRSKVAARVTTHWYELGLKLGFQPYQLNAFEYDSQSDIVEAAALMLQEWVTQSPARATPNALCLAMSKIDQLTNVAKNIRVQLKTDPDYLSKNHHPAADNQPAAVDITEMTAPPEEQNARLKNEIMTLRTELAAQSQLSRSELQKKDEQLRQAEQNVCQLKNRLSEEKIKTRQMQDEITELKAQVMDNEQTIKTLQRSQNETPAPGTHAAERQAEPGDAGDGFIKLYQEGTKGLEPADGPKIINRLQKTACCLHWEQIAENLGLKEIDIRIIEKDKQGKTQEQFGAVLRKWQAINISSNRTYRNLAKAVYDVLLKKEKLQVAIKIGREIILYPEAS